MPRVYRPFAKVRSSNATDSSFAAKIATTTEPTGTGVVDLAPSANAVSAVHYDQLVLVPFGAGSDDTTFSMRVIGWRKVTTLWVPVVLCQLACTLCTAVGIVGGDLADTDRLVDTLSITLGNENVDVSVISPAGASLGNIAGQAMIDPKGYGKLEFTFDMTGATSGNCLWAPI